ncbi:MAG: SlyX family protein [Xanthobacteraceae bacterium]|nr:SlyX family protein [Xanthobacteraceae bacterium]
MTASLVDRLDALEVRIAFQEDTIEVLNTTVTAQWAEIDTLKRQIARLNDRLHEAESRASGRAEPEPPPPHY